MVWGGNIIDIFEITKRGQTGNKSFLPIEELDNSYNPGTAFSHEYSWILGLTCAVTLGTSKWVDYEFVQFLERQARWWVVLNVMFRCSGGLVEILKLWLLEPELVSMRYDSLYVLVLMLCAKLLHPSSWRGQLDLVPGQETAVRKWRYSGWCPGALPSVSRTALTAQEVRLFNWEIYEHT